MRIRILGAGWYGCSIGLALHRAGHDVEIHETSSRIFSGASGNIPARLHLGFHYPRSRVTRAACLDHYYAFMERYGALTRGVPINLYAIARDESLVDFDQYRRTLIGEVEFVTVIPEEYGLEHCEGALLTAERHILSDRARDFFMDELGSIIHLNAPASMVPGAKEVIIDCTFAAEDAAGVDRYEPCLVLLLEGPVDRAVTIMDGPFCSLYPWDEARGLSSLSSARYTPFSKECRSYGEARALLDGLSPADITQRAEWMLDSMARFYPAIRDYRIAENRLSIRAMPKSGADSRLVDVVRVNPHLIRVRAGKIDAVIHAERMIKEMLR